MQDRPLPPLLPNLAIAFHIDRKSSWYSIRTPDNRFIRMGVREYGVACLLDGSKTAEQVALTIKEQNNGNGMDATEVLRVVDWLGKSGILSIQSFKSASPGAAASWNPIFIRQNFISGPTMEQVGRSFSVFLSVWMVPLVLALWLVAALAAICNWDTIWTFSQKLFVPDSLLWWGATWIFLKIMHEIGHATFAVKFGCRIHSAGICWMFFSPVPFVDVSGMWLNTNRWHRCLCCLGGIIFEMTISSAALLVFLYSNNETIRYICCMLFTMGAIASIVINGTPFMKFDGYHVLSEWLAWPNLYTDGQAAVHRFFGRLLRPWGSISKFDSPLLVLYGLFCGAYRCTFWLALLIGAYFAFQILGVIVIGGLLIGYVFVPMVGKWLQNFRQGEMPGKPARSLRESIVYHAPSFVWGSLLTLSLGVVFFWIPSPMKPMIPGFIGYSHPHLLRNETEGFVAAVHVRPGDHVTKGQVLAVLSNPDLETDFQIKQLEAITFREQVVLLQSVQSLGESQAMKAKLAAALEQLEQLRQKISALTLKSPCDGIVVDSYLHERVGQYVKSGEDLGFITEDEQLEVVGFVEQADIDWFRENLSNDLRIRLPEGTMAVARLTEVAPRGSEFLDSPQLAANFGGPLSIEVEAGEDGNSRWRLPKPRFRIKAKLSPANSNLIRPGQSVGLYIPDSTVSMFRTLLRLGEQYWETVKRESENHG